MTAPARAQPRPGAQDLEALKAACDALVAGASDPAAAQALIVKVWALGATASQDLLAELVSVAVEAAAASGTELSAVEVLEATGHHGGAAQIRAALQRWQQTQVKTATRPARIAAISSARAVPADPSLTSTLTSTSIPTSARRP